MKTAEGEGMRENCIQLYRGNAEHHPGSLLEVGSRAWHSRGGLGLGVRLYLEFTIRGETSSQADSVSKGKREDPSLIVSHCTPRSRYRESLDCPLTRRNHSYESILPSSTMKVSFLTRTKHHIFVKYRAISPKSGEPYFPTRKKLTNTLGRYQYQS